MGRRCCCPESCLIVSDRLLVRDLDEVFNVTGNFSVGCNTDYTDDNEAYYYDTLTFTGDFSLSLKYPKAIYNNDNFAVSFPGEVDSSSLASGNTVTETLTFSTGQNTLEVKSIRTRDNYNNYSFTIKRNNDVVYLKTNETTAFDHAFNNSSPLVPIISATHYIIRKDGYLYYYIDGFGLDTVLLCKVSDVLVDNLS